MVKYYVTRWKRKFTSPRKIRYSLRSFHFVDYQSALEFFQSADVAIYRVNLKSFDDSTGKSTLIGGR